LRRAAIAAFAQTLLVAEDFRDGADDGGGLIRQHEGVEAHAEMRSLESPPPTRTE